MIQMHPNLRQGRKLFKPPIKYMQIIVNLELKAQIKKFGELKRKEEEASKTKRQTFNCY